MKKEDSGLVRSTLEIVKYEERFGHGVCVKQPTEDMPLYGIEKNIDIHSIHSQLSPKAYHDGKPKIMWMHGEPLGSVANGISMKAILELAPVVDAFICMREEEQVVWNSIKRTYRVPKGIDLEVFKPIDGYVEKLSGEPSVLYIENWRGHRNPLYLCVAMQEVFKKYPNARLHLYNVRDKKMLEVFKMLIDNNKWTPFIRSINGPVKDVNELYNKIHY